MKVKNGRVVYLQASSGESVDSYWNIPIANTTVVLLGTGTSITQQAVAKLGEAGVMLGFCGTGGTPLHAGVEVEWINPQMEYRPTEYVQAWLSFWSDDFKRLAAAKLLQHRRLRFLQRAWAADPVLKQHRVFADDRNVDSAIKKAKRKIDSAEDVTALLLGEAELTKRLYAYVANAVCVDEFKRIPKASDPANRFLTHGNYLAYGQAASCLWCLGIPHGFAVMHGKTRKGALVFDLADVIKDGIVLPLAFIASAAGYSNTEFREACIESMTRHLAMDQMFESIKEITAKFGKTS